MPTAPSMEVIRFPIADLSDFFNKPLVTTRFAAGEFINKYKPKLIGNIRCLEIRPDNVTLVCTISDGAINAGLNDQTYRLFDCISTAFAHVGGAKNLTISAVNTTTNTLTASGSHNLSVGYRLQFRANGSPPAPFATGVNYWVLAAGLTATDFRLTDTQGSTTSVTITGTTLGGHFNSFGYTFDVNAGTVTLINPPAGRIFIFQPGGSTFTLVSNVIDAIAFTVGGMSQNNKDAASFTAALAADTADAAFTGIATHVGDLRTVGDILATVANGSRAWYGIAPDGLMKTGSLSLPAAAAVKNFNDSDVISGSMKMVDVLRPTDFSQSTIWYAPWFSISAQPVVPNVNYVSGDDYGASSSEITDGQFFYGPVSYGPASIPIDNHPENADSKVVEVINSLLNGAFDPTNRIVNFKKKTLGVYEFTTRCARSTERTARGSTARCPMYGRGWRGPTWSSHRC